MDKLVKSPANMRDWERSLAYQELLGFITAVSSSVHGKALEPGADSYAVSERCQRLNSLLARLNAWIDDIPPVEQPARFGNKAFKTWFQRLEAEAPAMISECLSGGLGHGQDKTEPELLRYFIESFGNPTRIDYGTGHELAFVAFLCCLFKTGFLVTSDCCAVALSVFANYLALVRRLQVTYRMEPAGSHGVWCLDDFQFVPFIWGSAQLVGSQKVQPSDIPYKSKAETLAKDNLFFGCLDYIFKVKSGPFEEHSSTLHGISGVASWDKVNSGLVKMYRAEILAKFPIIQHFYFGQLLPLKPASEFQRPV